VKEQVKKITIIVCIIFIIAASLIVYEKLTDNYKNVSRQNIIEKNYNHLKIENNQVSIDESINYQDLREKIYNFLKIEKNQAKVFNRAIALNEGTSANACVYFVSEVLRKNNIEVSEETCNTDQILSILQEKGWKKEYDYKKLKPGDLCFTTDASGDKYGSPTHAYIFMGWVNEYNYDYAYICDNQAKDYSNKVYHIRNIKYTVNQDGLTKDAFSFFMKPV
jgi:hypothetical protein